MLTTRSKYYCNTIIPS